jgi:hypothetical protein
MVTTGRSADIPDRFPPLISEWRRKFASMHGEADRHGEIELRLRHVRRKCRQWLRPRDHIHHLVVEVGVAGAARDMVRQHVTIAIEPEAQEHHTLFALRQRFARIALVTLQVLDHAALPGGDDLRGAALGALGGDRGGRLGLFDFFWRPFGVSSGGACSTLCSGGLSGGFGSCCDSTIVSEAGVTSRSTASGVFSIGASSIATAESSPPISSG